MTYLDRVPTDCNPADHPSRDDKSVAGYLGWVIAQPVIPLEYRAWAIVGEYVAYTLVARATISERADTLILFTNTSVLITGVTIRF